MTENYKSKQLDYNQDLFHYFVILPGQTRIPTFFNEFPREYFPLFAVFNIIEGLPVHIFESQFGWPTSAEGIFDYQIHFLQERELKEVVSFIDNCKFGCIFFLPGIVDETIFQMRKEICWPIITESYPDTIHLSDDEAIKRIYDMWKEKYPDIEWKYNQTDYSSTELFTTFSQRPLEITRRRIRGLYSNVNNDFFIKVPKRNFEHYEEQEGIEIHESFRFLLAEKFLTSYLTELIHNQHDLNNDLSVFGIYSDDCEKIIYEKDYDLYNKAIESIMDAEAFEQLSTDIILLVHSSNYSIAKYKNDKLEKRKQIPNKLIKAICDAEGYYPYYDRKIAQATSEEKTKLPHSNN